MDTAQPEKMAVNLSSERVRRALGFLEGVRNGQELGALLGYQFERGLHDRHGDPFLNQYIPLIRQAYPLVADKITPDPEGAQIESKEARNVFDGYALVEAAFLRESPLGYPYGIEGLPAADSAHGQAIREEVGRMADSLDAIADLALAEGVYQVTQGNYERAGAMMKALGEGGHPPEPEIVDTPRSGVAITQRVALHLPPAADGPPWPVPLAEGLTERARVEPGLNRWLADVLPPPDKIQYAVQIGEADAEARSLSGLGLQPIDLIYLINDELADETTELESRIVYEERQASGDDSLAVSIHFMAPPADPDGVNLFALLPLLRHLRTLVAGSRPLTALDFVLPGEANTNPADNPNPQGYELDELKGRMQAAFTRFDNAVTALGNQIPPPSSPDGPPDFTLVDVEGLRTALRTLAAFGVPDAFPRSAAGDDEAARRTLVDQAVSVHEVGMARRDAALGERTQGDDATLSAAERVEHYRAMAAVVFGPAFNLIPAFTAQNGPELQAAVAFREAPPNAGLTRFHADNPF
ncbi:MAG TPA: hypothetical protein VHN78_02605, partial [Chloroflexota bacterium]|nr:hypothetical protein [Chloroflexota bacterium]